MRAETCPTDRAVTFEAVERDRLKAVLIKIATDQPFRAAFAADPRAALTSGSDALDATTVDVLAENAELALATSQHLDAIEGAFFFVAKVVS